MARAATFTTYFNTRIDPSAEQAVSRYESRVVRAYDNMGAAAARANKIGGGSGIGSRAASRAAANDNKDIARSSDVASIASRRRTAALSAEKRATSQLTAENERMVRGLRTAAVTLNVVQGPLGPLAGRVSAVADAFTKLTGVSLGFAAVGGTLFAAGKLANEYANLEGRLRPLYDSQTQVNSAMGEIVRIARAARSELAPVADLYIKLKGSAADVGIDERQIGNLTRITSMAAALSGGSAETQKAGVGQFAQAIGSGVLSGDELKSVRENTFALSQAIADGLGVAVGELKKLGEQGALTSEVVAEALARSADTIEAKYAKLPITLSRATGQFGTSLTVMVGQFDQAMGLTSGLANAIVFLGDNLQGLVTLALGVGTAFAGIKLAGYIGQTYQSIAATVDFTKKVNALREARKAQAASDVAAARSNVQAIQTEIQQRQATIAALGAERRQRIENVRQQEIMTRAGVGGAYQLGAAQKSLADITRRISTEQALLTSAMGDGRTQAGRLVGATDQLSLAERRHEIAMKRSTTQARIMTSVLRVMGAVVSTLATVGLGLLISTLFALTTQASVTERALSMLTDEQRRLYEETHKATDAVVEQRAEWAKLQRDKAQGGVRDAADLNAEAQGDIKAVLRRAQNSVKFEDRPEIKALLAEVEKGAPNGMSSVLRRLQAVQDRNRRVFDGGLFGPTLTESMGEAFGGYRAANTALAEAQKAERRANEAIASAEARERSGARIGQDTGVPVVRLRAQANEDAISENTKAADAARRRFANAVKDLDAKMGVEKGKVPAANAAEYQKQYEALVRTRDAAIESGAAQTRASGAAARAAREATAEENRREAAYRKMEKAAEAAGEKRRDILGRYSEQPTAARRADDETEDLFRLADKQMMVDGVAFIGKTREEIEKIAEINPLGRDIYTQSMAEADARFIEQGLRRPLEEVFEQAELNNQIQGLRLGGYDLEARALERTLDIYRQIGTVDDDTLARLIQQEEREERLNDVIDARGRKLELINATVGQVRDSLETLLVDFPTEGSKAAVAFGKAMLDGVKRQMARSIVEKLTEGADGKVRALIRGTGGVEQAAQILASQMERDAVRREADATRIGTVTDALATDFDDTGNAAKELAGAFRTAANEVASAGTDVGIAGDTVASGVASLVGGQGAGTADVGKGLEGLVSGIGAVVAGALGGPAAPLGNLARAANDLEDASDDIVVVAKRLDRIIPRAANDNQTPSAAKVYDSVFAAIGAQGDKIFGTKFMEGIGGKVGKALEGVAIGQTASSFVGMTGLKQDGTAAAIGGAIGTFVGGPLGAAIGGAILGTIGGAFQRTPYSQSKIVQDEFGNLSTTAVAGQSGASNSATSQYGAALQDIANQLGAQLDMSASRVSIGTYGGHYRVSTKGFTGKMKYEDIAKGVYNTKDDLEATIGLAVAEALKQGVIKGISQASQNIIRSGQNIQTAIEKALIIESIPKRLMQKTDPVRAAVTELNAEFSRMILILKEGKATDQQYADAAKLYAIERAEAIEEASKRASSAIQSFIDDLTAGSSSPLNKRTTFENAQTKFQSFAADITAGKVVNEDKLLEAAGNFNQASRELKGSGAGYFADYEAMLALLAKARDNASSVTGAPGSAPLPGDPFASDAAVTAAIARANGQVVAATNNQTNQLANRLDEILAALRTGGTARASNDIYRSLPGMRNAS